MPTVLLYKMPQVIQISELGLSAYAVVNRTDFNLFRGVTNEIDFLLKNADRKPANLLNKTFAVFIVDETTNTLVIQSSLIVINETKGHLRMTLSPDDVAGLSNGAYRYSITETTGGKQLMIFTDQNRSYRGFLEVFDGPIPLPHPPIEIPNDRFVSTTWGTPLQTYWVSPSYPGAAQSDNRMGYHTIALYSEHFTGKLWIQASLENSPPTHDNDWFDVRNIELSNASGITSIQEVGNWMWVRFYYQPSPSNNGSVIKVLLKN